MLPYGLSQDRDLIRQGTQETHHDRVCMGVKNTDGTKDLIVLHGEVTFPSGSSIIISDVYLQDPLNSFNAVGGADISNTSTTFEISDIDLAPNASYELVIVFSASPGDAGVRVELEGLFD